MLSKLIVVVASIGFAQSAPSLMEAPSCVAQVGGFTNSVSEVVDPLIQDMRRRFAETPLIRHLKTVQGETKIDRIQRNSFLPYMTFFVNSFSDLNRMVLPFKDTQGDEIKEAINKHCEEDSEHLMLLWTDLEVYGPSMEQAGIGSFASSVKFLWGDALYATRKLGYEASRLVGSTGDDNPMYRYAMIRVMEEVGNVFSTTGAGYSLPNGLMSRYMSHDHLDLENGHLQTEETHGELSDYFQDHCFADGSEKDTMLRVMNETYQLFEDMVQAVYECMEASELTMEVTVSPS